VLEPFLEASRIDQADTTVCRAAFKVKEGLMRTKVVSRRSGNDGGGVALDLGAAPGGWTNELANAGYSKVVAIDPAQLDPTIAGRREVRHMEMKVETAVPLLLDEGVQATMCTCDMNFDARDAARACASAVPLLAVGAQLILTIKLPENSGLFQVNKQVTESTAILDAVGFGRFEVVHQMTNTPHERTLIATLLTK
jgi:23S rRNA (cytidine2498-2'-O)-methyltransferase